MQYQNINMKYLLIILLFTSCSKKVEQPTVQLTIEPDFFDSYGRNVYLESSNEGSFDTLQWSAIYGVHIKNSNTNINLQRLYDETYHPDKY
jgi:hypothetical protein